MGVVLFLLTITAKAQDNPSDYFFEKCSNSIIGTLNGGSNSLLTIEPKKSQLDGSLEIKEELNMFTGIEENDIIDYLIAYGCDIYLFLGIINANTDMK